MIILLTGASGAGKDTAANYLAGRYGFQHLKFANPLRDHVYGLYNLDSSSKNDKAYEHGTVIPETGNTVQQQLIETSREVLAQDPYAWIKPTLSWAWGEKVVISDCRQPLEYRMAQTLPQITHLVEVHRIDNPHQIQPLDNLLKGIPRDWIWYNENGKPEVLVSWVDFFMTLS